MTSLEDAMGGLGEARTGGDWGGILTRDEFLGRITRVAMLNNELMIELQVPQADGSTALGVYNLAEATAADKFL